ncbi:MAG TPA: RNA 2',3'-cyclic phosphodiesterase [Solirubrobacteraceae bacterium]
MSRGASARLFVAVELPLRICEELGEWARCAAADVRARGGQSASLRVLAVSSLHLTLCFLGSRPVGEIDALAVAIGDCDEPACELSVGAPLWLPPRRPRALAVEVHDHDGGLGQVHSRVSGLLSSVSGWQPEPRRFTPHITLMRIGRGAFSSRRSSLERGEREQPLPATPRLSFVPEAIVLYRSWLAPEGASYEVLGRRELTPAMR